MALPEKVKKLAAADITHCPEHRVGDLVIPATGTLRVFKLPGLHREQVFSTAVVKLRMMVEEMYREPVEETCGLCSGTGLPGPYRNDPHCPRCFGTGKVSA